jgi:hypothetical protein
MEYSSTRRGTLDDEIWWRIRNHITFKLGKEIEWHRAGKMETITAHRMKGLVEGALQGRFRLFGEGFNPADHYHYPFNQALMSFDTSEQVKQIIEPEFEEPTLLARQRPARR